MQFNRNNFDLIRLLAAVQVMLVHGWEHFHLGTDSLVFRLLWSFPGVPVFFVISGFLISSSWERNPSLRDYIRNRCLRIYPALWVCFVVAVWSAFSLYRPPIQIGEAVAWFFAQLTFGQFYNPESLRGYGTGVLNGSLWTIPVELQFYALLPLLYWGLKRLRWHVTVIVGGLVALVLVNQAFIHFGAGNHSLVKKLIQVTVFPYLYFFCIGILLQRNFWFVQRFLAGRALQIAAVYALATAGAFALGFNFGGNAINPVSAVLLSLLVISLGYTAERRLQPLLRGNDISYGVYLYHMVWVNVLVHLAMFSAPVNMVIAVVATLAAAVASWRFVEAPALASKRRTPEPVAEAAYPMTSFQIEVSNEIESGLRDLLDGLAGVTYDVQKTFLGNRLFTISTNAGSLPSIKLQVQQWRFEEWLKAAW